jgi:predicted DNA-binding transcriptional regulator YafY
VDQKNPNLYENRIVVPPVAASPVDRKLWNIITSALKNNYVIKFLYCGTYDDDYQPRRVRPYQLLFDSGVWYLYGYAEERKAVRVFTLSRIRDAVLTDTAFELPPDFDYCSRTDGSNFGVFSGEKKYRFSVAFYEESAKWVTERKWAANQVIKETDEGVEITFTSSQYGKVLEWVLSRGCTAEPLEPELLVKDWNINIEEMRKMSGGKS